MMTKRQMVQSGLQFAITLVATLLSLGHVPSGPELYMAVLTALGAALAIYGAAKLPIGGR